MKHTKQMLAVLLAATIGTTLLTGCFNKNQSDSESTVSSSSDIENVNTAWNKTEYTDENYQADEGKLEKDQYGSTVLAQSEDAGDEYIKNTLFIGDSNTVRMMAYGQTTLEHTIGVISMGIQHVPTKKCVYFKGKGSPVTIPEAVAIMQPQRIVITFGTNNTIGWSSQKFVEEYTKALKSITDAWPYADIIINAIPPVDKLRQNTHITMQTIDSFNKALADMAKDLGYKFLNSSEALKDSKTGFAKNDFTYSDGIHLNKKAMESFFEYIRTHSYITDDRRPKPLKKVPQRQETPPDIITEDPLAVRSSAQATETSSSSNSKQGYPVSFVVNSDSAGMGYLEGTLQQTGKIGQSCSQVTAIPSPGYEFDSWGCTIGRISNVKSPYLTFSIPGDATKEGIVVFARFKKAVCTCSVQCTAESQNTSCKACAGGIGNCQAAPAPTATPEPIPEPAPQPTPVPTPIPSPESQPNPDNTESTPTPEIDVPNTGGDAVAPEVPPA